MIPQTTNFLDKAGEVILSTSNTYKFDPNTGRIVGYVDGMQAVMQMIYLTLRTGRFDYEIYSDDFGSEFRDLYGQSRDYVLSVIEMRVKDALSIDSRIVDIQNFKAYEKKPGYIQIEFECYSTEGTFNYEDEIVLAD